MKLPGAPWRLNESRDYLEIIDSKNLVLAVYDLDDFSGLELSDLRAVARAIASLPGLMEQVARIIEADEKNDPEAADAAVDRIVGIYRELQIPIQTDGV